MTDGEALRDRVPGGPRIPRVPARDDDRAVEHTLFRSAFRQVASPVAVLLARTGRGGTRGITCTSAVSLSGRPPMLLVAVDDKTGMTATVRETGRFSVNFLAADRAAWAHAFSSRDQDLGELASVIVPGRTPVPTLAAGTSAVLECRTADVHRGGDHWILCGTVVHARFQADTEPLLYLGGSYGTFHSATGTAAPHEPPVPAVAGPASHPETPPDTQPQTQP
ncbi:flavin reductase (DIM6/NTAB) family NADH-FMN oxidoreductase RutF [Streptomyces sp. Amel2xB2]|uniref:flavin reductase family protein n=1 Tax=Streptomyces sp. Amel2xB2 TaxID=1305829 RepID=UPI000DB9D3C8|nr:flavin reductase family protein [Streptomyces sp. Amel2xB2]RAJ56576.1 flavin reductase (DIM6/NTAB) family NADH-FMN oxidoreductase RutF [Streptomyces sp. Amel2xB2]